MKIKLATEFWVTKFLDTFFAPFEDEVADAHPRLQMTVDGKSETVFGGHFSEGLSLRDAIAGTVDDRFDAQIENTSCLYETQFGRS